MSVNLPTDPPTVIVGAEDGLSRGYADVLAGKGINVFLISVTYEDLEDLEEFAQEIST